MIVSLHVQGRFQKTCILESDDPLQDLPELPPLRIGATAIGLGSVDKNAKEVANEGFGTQAIQAQAWLQATKGQELEGFLSRRV